MTLHSLKPNETSLNGTRAPFLEDKTFFILQKFGGCFFQTAPLLFKHFQFSFLTGLVMMDLTAIYQI